jgi:hypothetical protein
MSVPKKYGFKRTCHNRFNTPFLFLKTVDAVLASGGVFMMCSLPPQPQRPLFYCSTSTEKNSMKITIGGGGAI